ncbi:MAG: class I SAM-dependent methyltransferase [Candidatus Riflebacteria bacterium]|nr:class I SAM-dependent methyltransferase [Candidatus Riflebacteria bacterium]
MDNDLKRDYKNSLEFWNSRFGKESQESFLESTKNWKELAPSEKFIPALSLLSNCKKVLDYGCGNGWGSILLAKLGCKSITAVDLVKNAIDSTLSNINIFAERESIEACLITSDWLQKEETNKYDGFFCSNVIDVVPEEIANSILKEVARIVKPDSNVIISLNFFLDIQKVSNRQFELKNNNYIYREGILRMVSRSDDEWNSIFSEYFKVEKLVHFSWPGETTDTRRLFYLKTRKNN